MRLLHHILCLTLIFALSPCKELISLLDTHPITQINIPIQEQENQKDEKTEKEKEKEDQITNCFYSWPNDGLTYIVIQADDHLLPSGNHSNTETPPPNH